jgi:DNA-directed RNA polymerase specialized sigma24 family protein
VSSSDTRPPDAVAFATTRWSVVLAARDQQRPDDAKARAALTTLCHGYWYPLYAYVRRKGHAPHDAQDLTQDFFARLIEKDWLAGVAQERGRFRSFLLTAMKHFLANEWDKTQTQKRGGGAVQLSINDDTAESLYAAEPASADDETLYDRRWALTLLDRVLTRLRADFADAGKTDHFDALKDALIGDSAPYAKLAVRLRTTEGAVKVAVHRLRDQFRALLRAEIAETVTQPMEVEEELRHLFSVLAGAGG